MQITIEDAPPVPLPRRTAIGTCRFRNNVRRSSVWLAPACLALGLACGAISARSLFAQEETNPDGVNQELIDFSYNSKMMGIEGSKIITMCDNNPSIKKLILKGSYIIEGDEAVFF